MSLSLNRLPRLALAGDRIVPIIEVLPAPLMAVASRINTIKARRKPSVDQERETKRALRRERRSASWPASCLSRQRTSERSPG